MTDAVSQTLLWVNEELASTLGDARQALENYLERPENTAPLKTCADLMHEAAGALMMVEVQGGALLAEEVEQVARRMIDAPADQQTRGEALEALSRAMVQLPTYMERVVNGGRDIPLILLPLLNDLRAVRGQALLSENTLLLLNLPAERRLDLQRPADAVPSGVDIQALARQSRPRFQAALLGWIRGDRPDSSLAVMADVVGALEDASESDRCYQLWWVTAGVVEALRQKGLEPNAAIKRLLGQVDFQIRRLTEEGERAIEASPPIALLNSLLFYVARSSTRGRRVAAIRECFSLGDLMPPQQELESARDSLSAPSVRLMQTVGGAIRDDLSRVKDVLDIFVRTGMNQIDELGPQVDLLRKIGDTLGVLGLAGLQGVVHEQSAVLQAIVDGERTPDEDSLLATAGHLIEVEDNIERQLVGMITEEQAVATDGEDVEALEANRDFNDVTKTVLRECNVNLGRIKEAIVQALEAPLEPQILDEVPQLMRAITAGLLMLDRTRAVALVERVGSQIRDWLSISDGLPPDEVLDRLADAIVSLEYFMETIASGRSDPMYMLDNTEGCLDALEELSRSRGAALAALPQSTGEGSETLVMDSPFPLEIAADESAVDFAFEAPSEPPAESAVDRAVGPAAGAIDPELLELFIEEAGELAASMRERLPAWERAPEDEAPLADLQRLFHTLKGSGRMVGAELIGEFGWSLENLLSRAASGAIECSETLIAFVGDAIGQVPALIEQLETGHAPGLDVGLFIAQAKALAEGSDAVVISVGEAPAETTPAGAEPRPGEMDPVLRGIFAKEASEHLATIRDFLEDSRERAAPHAITEELYRACHTLAGSANMAGVTPAVAVARPLDRLVRSLHDDGAGMSGDVLELCEAAAGLFAQIIDVVRDGGHPEFDVADVADALDREHAEHAVRADAAPEPTSEPASILDLDPEIAAIFREEADEILERCDEVLQVWRTDMTAREPLDELQRQLHTLKGGARLAGLAAMGDLSHFLEDLVTRLLQDPTGCDEGSELIQRSLDELHRMREGIDLGQAVAATPALVAELTGRPLEVSEHEVAAPGLEITEAEAEAVEAPADLLVPEGAADEVAAIDFDLSVAEAEQVEVVDPASAEEPTEPEEAPASAESERTPVPARAWTSGPPPASAPQQQAVDRPPAAAPAEPEPAPAEEAPLAAEAVEPEAVESGAADEPLEIAAESADLEPTGLEEPAEVEPVVLPPIAPIEIPAAAAPGFTPVAPEIAAAAPGLGARAETARVDADLLEGLLNNAGEVSIYRSRLEQQVGSIEFNLEELDQTVVRLREQLRKFEMETDAQILHGQPAVTQQRQGFDSLEMDRYSMIQQLSRALAETASDVSSLQHLLTDLTRDADTLLTQQSRVISELQDGLMRTRMVPFSRHVQRLNRIVRQAAREAGKQASLQVSGGDNELDRQVMDRMLGPFEHLLRNAIIHGIEEPALRESGGKSATGTVGIELRRDGAEMNIVVSDDGSGLDLDAIRRKAESQGFIEPGAHIDEDAAAEMIFKPGFSTAIQLTLAAGRGVGMDVVANEIRELGGSLRVESDPGQGLRFVIRLPYTRAITQALILRAGDELFALPLPTVEGIARVRARDIGRHIGEAAVPFEYGGHAYRVRHLASLIDGQARPLPADDSYVPVILVRAGEHSTALIGDDMLGAREIVVKTLGPQLAAVRGVAGATILGDGSIVIILDVGALVRTQPEAREDFPVHAADDSRDGRTFVMVVDDSITVRRVTERLLERNGMRVITAKDGVDAVSLLREHRPDIMLLDIEMPRMDGYEVANHVRNDPRLKEIPIVMITSRVGHKHRARAIESGVNDYLGKPYQENQLLGAIGALVDEHRLVGGE